VASTIATVLSVSCRKRLHKTAITVGFIDDYHDEHQLLKLALVIILVCCINGTLNASSFTPVAHIFGYSEEAREHDADSG